MIVSDEYKAQLLQYHDRNKRWGSGAHRWADEIYAFCGPHCKILDFGCGKGTLKKALEGKPIVVDEYDPGIPGKDFIPDSRYDFVVSRDVLEHVEPEAIDDVLELLGNLSHRGAWFQIHTKAAGAILPDGRNAHLIQEGINWWHKKLEKDFPGHTIKEEMPWVKMVWRHP